MLRTDRPAGCVVLLALVGMVACAPSERNSAVVAGAGGTVAASGHLRAHAGVASGRNRGVGSCGLPTEQPSFLAAGSERFASLDELIARVRALA